MPQVPSNPNAPPTTGLPAPASPSDYLMAAADLNNQGTLSAPVPKGHPLQTGKRQSVRHKIRVVK